MRKIDNVFGAPQGIRLVLNGAVSSCVSIAANRFSRHTSMGASCWSPVRGKTLRMLGS
jgi:hypothetical protein